jgi:hypothetical protein
MSDRLSISSADLDDIRDAALFRFWCRMASYPAGSPIKLMEAFSAMKGEDGNITPDHYRKALYALALSEGVNLP